MIIVNQSCCRINHQGGASDNQHIRPVDIVHGLVQKRHVQTLLIEDHLRLDDAAAGTAGDTLHQPDLFAGVELSALHAAVLPDGSVNLQNFFAARIGVQTVDILGNNAGKLSLFLQLCQSVMGPIRLNAGHKNLRPVKPVKLLRLPHEKGVAEDRLRRIVILLIIQPVHTPEIRHAALRGNPGTAEKDDS